MKSQSAPQHQNPLFATAPAFADAAMHARFAESGGLSGLWQQFSWWMSGKSVLRDLPDFTPAIMFGHTGSTILPDGAQLRPTLLIRCGPCPTPVSADDGMDYITAYAAGCEVIAPAPSKIAPLWQHDAARLGVMVGSWASADEIEDPYCRPIQVLSGNNEIGTGNTDDLTWSVADLVAAASQIMPLPDGFIISCGMAVRSKNGKPIIWPAVQSITIEVEGLGPLSLT